MHFGLCCGRGGCLGDSVSRKPPSGGEVGTEAGGTPVSDGRRPQCGESRHSAPEIALPFRGGGGRETRSSVRLASQGWLCRWGRWGPSGGSSGWWQEGRRGLGHGPALPEPSCGREPRLVSHPPGSAKNPSLASSSSSSWTAGNGSHGAKAEWLQKSLQYQMRYNLLTSGEGIVIGGS